MAQCKLGPSLGPPAGQFLLVILEARGRPGKRLGLLRSCLALKSLSPSLDLISEQESGLFGIERALRPCYLRSPSPLRFSLESSVRQLPGMPRGHPKARAIDSIHIMSYLFSESGNWPGLLPLLRPSVSLSLKPRSCSKGSLLPLREATCLSHLSLTKVQPSLCCLGPLECGRRLLDPCQGLI